MKKTIFFDLDGTLIDTSERHYILYGDILELLGIPNTFLKEDFWVNKRAGKKNLELLPKNSIQSVLQCFSDRWLEKIEDVSYLKFDKLYDESIYVLNELKTKFNLVLVTLRKNEKNLLWELDHFDLNKYFINVLQGSPLELNDKSTLIHEYLELKPEKGKSIIIGDSEVDINSGKDNGLLSIAVTHGIRSRNFLEGLKPNFCIDNLIEVSKILDDCGDYS